MSLTKSNAKPKIRWIDKEPITRSDEIESLVKSLCQYKIRYKLEIDPEELLENIPTSANSFTAFLHQSYTDFFTNMKDLAGAAENLSICDPFFHEWTVSFRKQD